VGELPDEVTLRLDDERTFRLPSLAGAGYRWEATAEDGTIVEAEARFDDAVTSTSGHAAFSAHELLTLRGRKVGTSRVRCLQRRGWERQAPPLADRSITVNVVADGTSKTIKKGGR
jgi:predicted secreted protein